MDDNSYSLIQLFLSLLFVLGVVFVFYLGVKDMFGIHRITVIDNDNKYEYQVKDGDKLKEIKNRDGDFLGWYLQEEKYDFDKEVKDDFTLTAKYKPNTYQVTFNINGYDNYTISVRPGDVIYKPKDPVRKGYTFIEWQLNGETYDFNEVVPSSMTLDAIFVKD